MFLKSTLASIVFLGLALPALSAPHPVHPGHPVHPVNPGHPVHPVNPGHPGHPGHGHYHPGFHGHHHHPQGWWRPWGGHYNPGAYTCIARDSSGAEFKGYGWEAGEKAIDQCYQFSYDPDECQVTWCG